MSPYNGQNAPLSNSHVFSIDRGWNDGLIIDSLFTHLKHQEVCCHAHIPFWARNLGLKKKKSPFIGNLTVMKDHSAESPSIDFPTVNMCYSLCVSLHKRHVRLYILTQWDSRARFSFIRNKKVFLLCEQSHSNLICFWWLYHWQTCV